MRTAAKGKFGFLCWFELSWCQGKQT